MEKYYGPYWYTTYFFDVLVNNIFILLLWLVMTMYVKHDRHTGDVQTIRFCLFYIILGWLDEVTFTRIRREGEVFYSGFQFAETKGEMSVLAIEKFKSSCRGKFTLRDLSCLWPQRSSGRKNKGVEKEMEEKEGQDNCSGTANKEHCGKSPRKLDEIKCLGTCKARPRPEKMCGPYKFYEFIEAVRGRSQLVF